MPAHRIFDKGKSVWAIVMAYNMPHIHLPVKCTIMDTSWDPVNPKYVVKIIKFYDTWTFVSKHFFDMTFSKSLQERPRPMYLEPADYKSMEELECMLSGANAERYYVVIDSVMCFGSLGEMKDRFNKLQLYIISKNLKQIRESTSRSIYSGPMKTDSGREFKARMNKAWRDTFDKSGIDADKYMDSLD